MTGMVSKDATDTMGQGFRIVAVAKGSEEPHSLELARNKFSGMKLDDG